MFSVHGVSLSKCRANAVKKVNELFGTNAPKTPEEWEAKVAEMQMQLFLKSKPASVSGEFQIPSTAFEFIEQAKKHKGEYRDLKAMRRRPALDKSGNQIVTKAKRIKYEWVPLELDYKDSIANKESENVFI
ncbi:hypothetical protein [Pseudoalteromonas obscura]|uniref:Uncharacterized protein n=1 Tax=Pseudoalteromonas obscura TaxID=3048491 RepID=A0ABT7EHB0_9GAMM|nr:hypothetical protein [Pseudoalteromonas sp. P94(2023)]MDK2594426.1 hypothetical protein [Pseudoalteromonas sp. P94(2023)]